LIYNYMSTYPFKQIIWDRAFNSENNLMWLSRLRWRTNIKRYVFDNRVAMSAFDGCIQLKNFNWIAQKAALFYRGFIFTTYAPIVTNKVSDLKHCLYDWWLYSMLSAERNLFYPATMSSLPLHLIMYMLFSQENILTNIWNSLFYIVKVILNLLGDDYLYHIYCFYIRLIVLF